MIENSLAVLILSMINALSFLTYGFLCLFTNHMKSEFERYNLAKYRKLVGVLEILGGSGIIIGLYSQTIYLLAALGLSLLMLLGIMTRIKVKDSFLQILPATFLLLINLFLFSISAHFIPAVLF